MALPLSAILGLAQTGVGLAKGMFNKRPEYDIPASQKAALETAKMQYLDKDMPGAGQLRDDARLTAANASQLAAETGNAAESAAAIAGTQNRAMRNLAVASAQDQQRDTQNLQQQLGLMAQAEDLKFQMNEFAPYADKYQEGRQMVGAGIQNLAGGMDAKRLLDLAYMKDRPATAVGQIGTRNLMGGVESINKQSLNSRLPSANDLRKMLGI